MDQKPKHLFHTDEWMLAEEIPDSDIFFFQVPMSCFASDSSYPFLKNYKRVVTHYKKFHMDFYFGETDSYEVAESALEVMFKKPNFGKEINKNIVLWSNKLIAYARHTVSQPLKQFTNKQLWELYKKQDEIHTKLYTYGWIPVATDLMHNNYTKRLKSYLYSICESKEQAENAFIVLTTPTEKTIVAKEREEFLKIYAKYQVILSPSSPGMGRRSRVQPTLSTTLRVASSEVEMARDRRGRANDLDQLMTDLKIHSSKWGHLGYIYAGNVKPFGVENYFKELKEIAETGVSAQKILQKEKHQLLAAKAKQKTLIKKLKISKPYQIQFEAARKFAITKLYRRHAQLLHLYLMHTSLLPEISRRLKLTRYQVQFMLTDEVRQALQENKNFKSVLIKRLRECVLYTEKGFEAVYIGTEAKKIIKTFKKFSAENVTEVSGQTAQPGFAKGVVKIVYRAKDMKKFNKGDILISVATDPDIVPAMKKAAAIVTEQGGITSHAAIVSRELGIPCIIGTKIATKVFKDGDRVEVDANKGTVKKIS